MPYDPNLRGPTENPRKAQSERYNNLARFVARINTRNGTPIHTEGYWRDRLAFSRVLTRDGHVRPERLEKLLARHGTKTEKPKSGGNWFDFEAFDDDDWDSIVEGGS